MCLFPPTKAYVELIGVEIACTYLQYMQYIYCKVKQWIQRELSHTVKSRCECVWMNGGYIWWLILILLCSLKTYLSFETWKILLQENMGYLIHLFLFSDRHLSTHYFKYLKHLSIFLISLFSSFFMNNFCIAHASFL